jgi:hypothetical protein
MASFVMVPSSPGAIRGCKVTDVPPRRSRPNLTEVAPWMKTRPVIATKTNAKIAKVLTGRLDVLIGLFIVDISAESRRQRRVSRKA